MRVATFVRSPRETVRRSIHLSRTVKHTYDKLKMIFPLNKRLVKRGFENFIETGEL